MDSKEWSSCWRSAGDEKQWQESSGKNESGVDGTRNFHSGTNSDGACHSPNLIVQHPVDHGCDDRSHSDLSTPVNGAVPLSDLEVSEDVEERVKKLRKEAKKRVRWWDQSVDAIEEAASSSLSMIKPLRKSPCGLKNIGNSCYINAVIQCLCIADRCLLAPHAGVGLLVEYEKLIGSLRNVTQKTVTPSRFKRELCMIKPSFHNCNPQDAHELLMTLFNEFISSEMDRDRGAFERLSWGILKSEMKCSGCLHVSKMTGDDSYCLSLELPIKSNASINDCLEQFLEEEVIPLEQKWRCMQCGTLSAGKKKLLVEITPELLVLHLKRFKQTQGRWTKDSRDVDVPEEITLRGLEYHLIAVAEHSGSYESGHYTALVKMDDRWFSCSDKGSFLLQVL